MYNCFIRSWCCIFSVLSLRAAIQYCCVVLFSIDALLYSWSTYVRKWLYTVCSFACIIQHLNISDDTSTRTVHLFIFSLTVIYDINAKKTYQFTTQCKGDISHAFKTAKITVFDPMMWKSPDVPLQAELLRLTIQLRTSQASVLALLNGWEYQFKLGTYYIILQVINTAARLVRAHVDFFTSWGQTRWFLLF